MRNGRTGRGAIALIAASVLLARYVGIAGAAESAATIEQLRVEVIAAYPHDPEAFTQGLVLHDGALYESTGLVGSSTLRQVDPTSGKVLRRLDVPPPFFAEGLAVVGDRLVQLTLENHVAFVYARATLEQLEKLSYPTKGWGLCFDGTKLVMSDGSSRLYYRDWRTFDARGVLKVTRNSRPLERLNELECVGDAIYANVWKSDTIVRIDGATGAVTGEVDASGLLSAPEQAAAGVLNGIAYDASDQTFLITGKRWPRLFRVRFVPKGQS